jgi:hypothetical protein
MTGFVIRALITAIGLWIATRWINGIRIDDAGTLVLDRLPGGRVGPHDVTMGAGRVLDPDPAHRPAVAADDGLVTDDA